MALACPGGAPRAPDRPEALAEAQLDADRARAMCLRPNIG